MSLPKVKSAVAVSQIGDKKIKIRAYSGVEEKALLLAKLQNDKHVLLKTVVEVLTSVANGFDVSSLTTSELERLFLDVRSISVSDTIETGLVCKAEDCGEVHRVKIPVSKIKNPEKFSEKRSITAGQTAEGDDIIIVLKTPTVGSVIENLGESDKDVRTIFGSIETIQSSKGEVFDDFEFEEFKEWFMALTGVYAEALLFIQSSPSMTYESKFKCAKCKTENEIKLEGIHDFFR
ncbi:baseplate hub subunit [Agrobacterium phage Atu_ph04]|uniref:Baseplate hub subunit n=1 Tax=Agrobacterium phage Atu_ph04 TaxID=2024263 RepID=A0A223VZX6_9CAUD|nr:baseplate hub [Agrobacterium phage Atu_ph04]ASV44609.1 baseplate hub subunit [Agrobacterium phage Atu_ph04]